jgi:drug/metabolite transporter (DMT)-like permease
MTDAPAPQSTRLAILIPFGIVTLIWGSTWIVIRDQLGVVPPSWSVTYRFLLAGVAMLAWAAWKREALWLDARGWMFATAIGLLQFCMNFNFVYRAEHHITSGLVAVTFALLLVPNAVLARIFLGQRMGTQLLVGSGVAICGVALLFWHEARANLGSGDALIAGMGLTLAGVAAASSANVLQATPMAKRYPMVATLGVAMLIGAAIDAVYAWITAGPPVFDARSGYWLGVVYLAIAASAIAFPLYFGIIRTIGPAKAAYSGVIVPVIAMTLSTVFEGYRWSALAAAGAVLVAIGMVIALRARRPNR